MKIEIILWQTRGACSCNRHACSMEEKTTLLNSFFFLVFELIGQHKVVNLRIVYNRENREVKVMDWILFSLRSFHSPPFYSIMSS